MIAALQTRIAALLGAASAFDGVEIITDDRPDWVSTVAQAIGRQDLIVVVGLAEGESVSEMSPAPVFTERVRVAILQHHLHTAHSAGTLMQAAIIALHRQPVTADGKGPERLYAISHRHEVSDDGVISAELTVQALIHIRAAT